MLIENETPTVSEYNVLRDLVGWWQTDENATGVGLRKSLFSVVAKEQGKLVGFGRIVGDGGLYFYIQDLMVHPCFQGRGLGKTLMKELMDYIKTNAKPGAFVGLMAAKGLAGYYESFGFKLRDKEAPGMYQVIE